MVTDGLAGWQSGYAEDCKSLYVGSIPVPASIFLKFYLISSLKRAILILPNEIGTLLLNICVIYVFFKETVLS